jgi:hypothetical protein
MLVNFKIDTPQYFTKKDIKNEFFNQIFTPFYPYGKF